MVYLSQPWIRHMQVALRGGEAGVAKQQLHGAQVGAPIEQMGRERMPQCVRMRDVDQANRSSRSSCRPCGTGASNTPTPHRTASPAIQPPYRVAEY
jgi:hypothetical protein